MSTTLDETGNTERDDLIEKAASFAASRKGTGGPPGGKSAELLRYFYRHVATEDLASRTEVDLYGAAMSQYKEAAYRPQGTANIRVFTPTVAEHGWSAGGHTVVEVVTDDMPFLVDSVTMELNEQNREVHMVVHPQILVRRDITGQLEEIFTGDDQQVDRADLPHDVSRESWMHIEIGRESSQAQRDEIEQALVKVLQDVREAVEDWPKMHQQALDIIEDLDAEPAAAAGRGDRRGPGAAALAGRHPLHVPGLPRVPPRGGRRRHGRRRAAGPARHRLRHPALRPGHVHVVREAAPAGAVQGPGEDAAGAGQGQLQGHRAPSGLPRLRRRQDVRRERRGRRRAALPRAVLVRRLHRVADPHPGDPASRPSRSSTRPGSRR